MLSYGERIRKRTQAQAVSHTKQAKSALSSAGSERMSCNAACLKLENVLHVLSGYLCAGLRRVNMQVEALEHAKMKKTNINVLVNCTVKRYWSNKQRKKQHEK